MIEWLKSDIYLNDGDLRVLGDFIIITDTAQNTTLDSQKEKLNSSW